MVYCVTKEREQVNPVIELITDDGYENKCEVEQFIGRQDINIKKIVARLDIIFSNSMVEAVNKRMKYDFLYTRRLPDFEHTLLFLDKAVIEYNQKPHSALSGLTPHEVFNGQLSDENMFKPAIQASKNKRTLINLHADCFEIS